MALVHEIPLIHHLNDESNNNIVQHRVLSEIWSQSGLVIDRFFRDVRGISGIPGIFLVFTGKYLLTPLSMLSLLSHSLGTASNSMEITHAR